MLLEGSIQGYLGDLARFFWIIPSIITRTKDLSFRYTYGLYALGF